MTTEYLDLVEWLRECKNDRDGVITPEIQHAGDIIKAGGLVAGTYLMPKLQRRFMLQKADLQTIRLSYISQKWKIFTA